MIDELSREDVSHTVDRLVSDFLNEVGIHQPPVDALMLLQNRWASFPSLARKKPGPSSPASETPVFVLPEGATDEEKHWQAALAMADSFREILQQQLGVAQPNAPARLGVSLSKLFAERFLMPTAWFGGDASSSHYDLLELKDRYRTVTYERIAMRFLDLPSPCIVTILDDGSIYKRRSNLWRVKKRLEEAEKMCQELLAEQGGSQQVRHEGWTVQGWIVPSMRWQRVILRSVVEGDGLGTE